MDIYSILVNKSTSFVSIYKEDTIDRVLTEESEHTQAIV